MIRRTKWMWWAGLPEGRFPGEDSHESKAFTFGFTLVWQEICVLICRIPAMAVAAALVVVPLGLLFLLSGLIVNLIQVDFSFFSVTSSFVRSWWVLSLSSKRFISFSSYCRLLFCLMEVWRFKFHFWKIGSLGNFCAVLYSLLLLFYYIPFISHLLRCCSFCCEPSVVLFFLERAYFSSIFRYSELCLRLSWISFTIGYLIRHNTAFLEKPLQED